MTCESGLEGSSLVALIFVFSFIFRPPSSNCQWLYSLVKFYRCIGTFSGDHLLFFSVVSTRQWFNVTHDATFFLGTCLTRGSSGPAGGTIVHTERGGGLRSGSSRCELQYNKRWKVWRQNVSENARQHRHLFANVKSSAEQFLRQQWVRYSPLTPSTGALVASFPVDLN